MSVSVLTVSLARNRTSRARAKWTVHAGELGADDPFDLTFTSRGFRQYLRQPPMLTAGECLSLEARGGISFAEESAS